MVLFWILSVVTASGAILAFVTAPLLILAVVTAPLLILAVVTAPLSIFTVVTAPLSILPVVTAPLSIFTVVTAPLSILPVVTAPLSIFTVVTAPLSILPVVTAPLSILPVVTAIFARSSVATVPSRMSSLRIVSFWILSVVTASTARSALSIVPSVISSSPGLEFVRSQVVLENGLSPQFTSPAKEGAMFIGDDNRRKAALTVRSSFPAFPVRQLWLFSAMLLVVVFFKVSHPKTLAPAKAPPKSLYMSHSLLILKRLKRNVVWPLFCVSYFHLVERTNMKINPAFSPLFFYPLKYFFSSTIHFILHPAKYSRSEP